jgi:hypothetical protein
MTKLPSLFDLSRHFRSARPPLSLTLKLLGAIGLRFVADADCAFRMQIKSAKKAPVRRNEPFVYINETPTKNWNPHELSKRVIATNMPANQDLSPQDVANFRRAGNPP